MGLGLGLGNNWKLAVVNFLVIFGAQAIFELNDIMDAEGIWPSWWMIGKTVLTSAVATLIFYGYNKMNKKEA